MIKIKMDAPARDEELALARRTLGQDSPERTLANGSVNAVLADGELARLRTALQTVTLRDELAAYAVDLVRATRTQRARRCTRLQMRGGLRGSCLCSVWGFAREPFARFGHGFPYRIGRCPAIGGARGD